MLLLHMGSRLVLTVILLFVLYFDSVIAATTLGNETDRLSLLSFKAHITDDPLQVLSSWNSSINFCDWQGVTCSQRHQRVTVLNLRGQRLVGSISPYIGNLTFLRSINLQDNRFQGAIPQDIGRLFRLQYLELENNTFEGDIPSNLTNCSDLRILGLTRNNLAGSIPAELGSLSKLVTLSLSLNNLTGGIPSSLGNLSSLQRIAAAYNAIGGSIPDTVGQILSLTAIAVGVNRLSGRFPPSFYNISSINTISLARNHLEGNLPPDIGLTLPNLRVFAIAGNNFSGPIPLSFSNASQLEIIDIQNNNFAGEVPGNLGELKGLRWLNIGGNGFGNGTVSDLSFLNSLTNCTGLQKLGLSDNRFGGVLPDSFSNLSTTLDTLEVSRNRISGGIPMGIGNLVGLNTIAMGLNIFTGSIPTSIGRLQNLQRLYLYGNRFTGQIPSSLGNITHLSDLHLENNRLEGSIPVSLGDCQYLQMLDLSMNNLNGSIPQQVIGFNNQPFLLVLSHNSLTGSLPAQVGNLRNLGHLDVSDNALSGELPSALGNCLSLELLYLADNFFQGAIPPSLVSLKGIRELNLSNNKFSGKIPTYLETFSSLQILSLSFNDFEGEVPIKGVFGNASAVSLVGNRKLCGGITEMQLPTCPIQVSVKLEKSRRLKLIIVMTSVGLCLCLVLVSCSLLYYWRRKPKREPSATPLVGDQLFMVSYKDLVRATDGFSSENLIGLGSFGHVYKGILDQCETTIAVKVFNCQQRGASKSFLAECEALRNIRHRNLVKILTSCSSVDFEGNDFKALIFEFMPNGSLEKWIHADGNDVQNQWKKLNLTQRLNVAADVACALNYLHHQCHIPIIHRDLKPSNVLLDDEMIAHVGDFGLARLLSTTTKNFSMTQTNSIGIKGSIGYTAPEYGMGSEASKSGDVYSYGVLLLEMFLGRKPTDEMFKDGSNLHNFARMALPEQVMEIVDPVLLDEEVKPKETLQECLTAVVRIGVACSAESPGERMNMDDVTRELSLIRDIFLASTGRAASIDQLQGLILEDQIAENTC